MKKKDKLKIWTALLLIASGVLFERSFLMSFWFLIPAIIMFILGVWIIRRI